MSRTYVAKQSFYHKNRLIVKGTELSEDDPASGASGRVVELKDGGAKRGPGRPKKHLEPDFGLAEE